MPAVRLCSQHLTMMFKVCLLDWILLTCMRTQVSAKLTQEPAPACGGIQSTAGSGSGDNSSTPTAALPPAVSDLIRSVCLTSSSGGAAGGGGGGAAGPARRRLLQEGSLAPQPGLLAVAHVALQTQTMAGEPGGGTQAAEFEVRE